MKRYWCSWIEPLKHDVPEPGHVEPGYVELRYGGTTRIEQAWVTGFMPAHGIVVAVVDADSEREVKAIVRKEYSPSEWRFVDEKPAGWWPGPMDS